MSASKHIYRGLEGLSAVAGGAAAAAVFRSRTETDVVLYLALAGVMLIAWALAGAARDGSSGPAQQPQRAAPTSPSPPSPLLPEITRERRDGLIETLVEIEQLTAKARKLGLDLSADTIDVHHARDEAVAQRDGWKSRALGAESTIRTVHATAAQYTAPKLTRLQLASKSMPEATGAQLFEQEADREFRPDTPVPLDYVPAKHHTPVNLDSLRDALNEAGAARTA